MEKSAALYFFYSRIRSKGEIIMEKKISWKNAVEYGGILVGAFLTVKYPATVYVLFLILWGIRNL